MQNIVDNMTSTLVEFPSSGARALILRFDRSDVVWCGLSSQPPTLPHLLACMKSKWDESGASSTAFLRTEGCGSTEAA